MSLYTLEMLEDDDFPPISPFPSRDHQAATSAIFRAFCKDFTDTEYSTLFFIRMLTYDRATNELINIYRVDLCTLDKADRIYIIVEVSSTNEEFEADKQKLKATLLYESDDIEGFVYQHNTGEIVKLTRQLVTTATGEQLEIIEEFGNTRTNYLDIDNILAFVERPQN